MHDVFHSLESLVQFFGDQGVARIYVKHLACNDNSKNQVYFGPGFESLTLFPMNEICADPTGKEAIFKATVDFLWIGDDHSLVAAPTAQVILYPQYPEIRFSGFLKGADRSKLQSTRELMASRLGGRALFLGTDRLGRIIGTVLSPTSTVAKQLGATLGTLNKATEIFYELHVAVFLGTGAEPRKTLLQELCRIHRLDWINSKRLNNEGQSLPCNAPQCGGYTLEAELGIRPNGRSEPDFMGWEVKQHGGSVLTLMTPEPTAGYYAEKGVEQFVRTFGYPDKCGKEDRLNFGGVHFCNVRHGTTGLTLRLEGYDAAKNCITNQNGGIVLEADDGTVAAFWEFAGLLKHWNRKHRNAVYIPSEHRVQPSNQYRYGGSVILGEGTDPLHLLSALESGKVYYDPAIKVEGASRPKSTIKRRSQFRVKQKHLGVLYDLIANQDVTNFC
jgi:MvaI/BcnI restriction endonuclease family